MDSAGVYVDRVRERDLDNFLVEELQSSLDFRRWFLSRLEPGLAWPSEKDVRLRKSPPRQDRRQTDVEMGAFDDDGRLIACVLIESKVTADFQPGQAEAYAAETARRRVELGAERVCSALVAPARRLDALDHRLHFDAAIALEDVIASLVARRLAGNLAAEIDARLAVRIDLLEALCGKRAGTGWIANTVAAKRDFARAYEELAVLAAPDLAVNPSTDGPKSLTRTFSGLKGLDALPSGVKVKLKHEFGKGVPVKYANLQFTGFDDREAGLAGLKPLVAATPFYLRSSDAALFVETPTPGLDPDIQRFDAQRPDIIQGLEAIVALARWFEDHASRLTAVFAPTAPSASVATTSRPTPTAGEPSRAALEARLGAELRDLIRRSIAEFNYPPHDFSRMLEKDGPVATARRLLAGVPSRGFMNLAQRGELSVTVEALVIQEPWRSSVLFNDEEIARAEERLRRFGYHS